MCSYFVYLQDSLEDQPMWLKGHFIASYPGSLGEGKKEPGIYCLRMRLIKI